MTRHPTLGFEIVALPVEAVHVIVGELSRPVEDLAHAPSPLCGIREVVSSGSYGFASRRYQREMESQGVSSKEIIQRMNEPTPFTRVELRGELAVLPQGTALRATNPVQQRMCVSALNLARRRDVEGFELRGAGQERPRLLFLEEALEEAMRVFDCHHFVPAHFLPGRPELFEFGR